MIQMILNKSIYWSGSMKEVVKELKQLSDSSLTVLQYIESKMSILKSGDKK